MNISRELIQDKNLRKATPMILPPSEELTYRCATQHLIEAGAHQLIELKFRGPPRLGIDLIEPEGKNFVINGGPL